MLLYFTLAVAMATLSSLAYFGKLTPKEVNTESKFEFYRMTQTIFTIALALIFILFGIAEIFDNYIVYIILNSIGTAGLIADIVFYFIRKSKYEKIE